MSIVIDASLAMTWYFDDESTAATDELLDRVSDDGAVVPGHWHLEVANAFQMASRRKRIDAIYRDASLAELAWLSIVVDDDTYARAWSSILRLSERFALTIYDAAYLEVAQRRSLPLATLDQELRAAAPTLGIDVFGKAA